MSHKETQEVLSSAAREASSANVDQKLTEMWKRIEVQNRLFGGVTVCIGVALLIIGIWIPMRDWPFKGLLISLALLFGYFGRQVLILTATSRFVCAKDCPLAKLESFLTQKQEFDRSNLIIAANCSLSGGFCFVLFGLANYLLEHRFEPIQLWALMVGLICLALGGLLRRMAH